MYQNIVSFIKRNERFIAFLIGYTIVFLIFSLTLKYILPFLIGGAVAFKLIKPTEFMIKRWRVAPKKANLITTVIFYLIVVSVVGALLVLLVAEITSLISNLQLGKISIYLSDIGFKEFDFYKNLDGEIVDIIQKNVEKFGTQIAMVIVSILQGLLKTVSSIPYIIMTIIFSVIATYFSSNELLNINKLNTQKYKKIIKVSKEAKDMGSKYIGAYLSLILITFVEALILFSILKVKYAVLLALVCAVLDLMPVIGIGSVFVPFATISYLNNNPKLAIWVLICWGIMIVVRQIIEPKLLSNSLNISPLVSLMAIFIGLNTFGVIGIVYIIFMIIAYKACKQTGVLI